MRRATTLVLVVFPAVLAFTASLSFEAAAQEIEDEFVAFLRGEQEVPPVATESRGRAEFRFTDDFTRLTFELTVRDGRRVQQAHIHCAPRGVNGPIILFLAGFHDRGWNVDGEWVDNATLTNHNILDASCGSTLRQIARAMAAGGTYANVHTEAHPAGEIRGQIRPAPEN